MKATKFVLQILLLTTIVATGCEKEIVKPISPQEEANTNLAVRVENGTLSFSDAAHLYDYLEGTAGLSSAQRRALETRVGFQSLNTLFEDIQAAEEQHMTDFYKGLSPDLSAAEYVSMGYSYTPTALYQEGLEKGYLVETIEADQSRSYSLAIDNPGFVSVLNADGDVFAGGKRYHFVGTRMQVFARKTNTLLHDVDFSAATEITSNWSQDSGWQYDGSDKRFSYKVYGTCITSANTSSSGIIESSFYVQARGENKKFATWAARSSYLPVYSFSGNWTANYTAKSCFNCVTQTNPLVLNDNDYASPFSWHSASDPNGQTNNFTRYFKPNGSWTLSGWYIQSAFDVHYTMTFTFSGGPSGYVRTLTR
jgi:hypothetical protein